MMQLAIAATGMVCKSCGGTFEPGEIVVLNTDEDLFPVRQTTFHWDTPKCGLAGKLRPEIETALRARHEQLRRSDAMSESEKTWEYTRQPRRDDSNVRPSVSETDALSD